MCLLPNSAKRFIDQEMRKNVSMSVMSLCKHCNTFLIFDILNEYLQLFSY